MKLIEQEGKKVYSDTEELEKEMLDIARNYPGDNSQDIIALDNRYTVNNTFSSVRHNLLNWYNFKQGATILEVGAGMGAITGCLCDKADKVVSIEMSKKRAEVIENRFRNSDNLTILCEDIFDLQLSEKFDYVVVVGVLEYSPIFGEKYEDPPMEFIKALKRFLKPDGIVLLAIENRFGLKYWCGASEDHLCQPFKGIAGYKEAGTAITFSKNELKELFERSGFKSERFYYVLPDYKFPTVIYTDDVYPTESVIQKLALNYVKGSCYIYDEKKLYKDIFDNKVGGFFANSFLVEAFNGKEQGEQPRYIACKGECKKEYRVSTMIYSDKTVEKRAVHVEAQRHLDSILKYEQELCDRGIRVIKSERVDEMTLRVPYFQGKLAEDYFHHLLKMNDKEGIKSLINNLKDNLLKSSEIYEGDCLINHKKGTNIRYGKILKNAYIDMTLSNCFLGKCNELIFFDQEWMFEEIPVDFIIFQALRQSYLSYVEKTKIKLEQLFNMFDIEDFVEDYIWLERYLWNQILYRQEHFYDGDGWYNQYDERESLENELARFQNIEREWWQYKEIIEEKNRYIIKLEQSIDKKNKYICELETERERFHCIKDVLREKIGRKRK